MTNEIIKHAPQYTQLSLENKFEFLMISEGLILTSVANFLEKNLTK